MDDFAKFFQKATGHTPYEYQKHLAAADAVPDTIDLPTGSGKTAAAILAVWLWRRCSGRMDTPRRLVYCLPRRSLVEQTVECAREWVGRLGLECRIGVSQVMGGDSDWNVATEPEREYILVGTQDMLLSGALNRQYGKGFTTWPMYFALLNNDCLWVMDEIQLMENGLPTSRQLDALRRSMGTFGPVHTVWMSATVNERWLETPDSKVPKNAFRLTGGEAQEGGLGRRNAAPKTVRKADIVAGKPYDRDGVRKLLGFHRPGTPTAIIVNRVRRAQEIYAGLKRLDVPCILVHSRFRAAERRAINERISNISESDDIIIVSTQVLEAGVDLSVRTLVTELAPWHSMVQRFGRCNRGAEHGAADIVWMDIRDEGLMVPYAVDDMERSRNILLSMEGDPAPPAGLPRADVGMEYDTVLRRRDVVDLFDTAQDLSRGRTDASVFVRTSKRRMDVDVFWRDADNESPPHAGEVCPVPLADAISLAKAGAARTYDHAAGRWVPAADVRPGQTMMLECSAGGYTPDAGWDPKAGGTVSVVDRPNKKHDARPGRQAVTLADHTEHVVAEAERLAKQLDMLGPELAGVVVDAARHHDVGKAHPVFQDTMVRGGCSGDGRVWAKSPGNTRHDRPGFRHEAASALAYLARHPDSRLTAYLMAAHHGHVRLSMRSTHPGNRYMLGLSKNDRLPAYDGGGISMPETKLDTSMAGLGRGGGPSWADMATGLLERYGPFRLAYMEMLVRAADQTASGKEDAMQYGRGDGP